MRNLFDFIFEQYSKKLINEKLKLNTNSKLTQQYTEYSKLNDIIDKGVSYLNNNFLKKIKISSEDILKIYVFPRHFFWSDD